MISKEDSSCVICFEQPLDLYWTRCCKKGMCKPCSEKVETCPFWCPPFAVDYDEQTS